jgi:hypothetical protein
MPIIMSSDADSEEEVSYNTLNTSYHFFSNMNYVIIALFIYIACILY